MNATNEVAIKRRYRNAARRIYCRDNGMHAIDYGAFVSPGAVDNGKLGRYVQCWVWVGETELRPEDTKE